MIDTMQFGMKYEGERFIFEIHTENPAHEARIRWENVDQDVSGKWGRLYVPDRSLDETNSVIREPTLAFGGHEPITINEQERSSIELPRSLAAQLQESLDELGTAIIDKEHVCDDASRFPSTIHYQTKIATERLDKMCWDPDRYLMWYSPNKPMAQNVPPQLAELISQLDVYGYQIVRKNGELIHRTEEYPSDEAVEDLRNALQQAVPDPSTENDTDPYRIDEQLK